MASPAFNWRADAWPGLRGQPARAGARPGAALHAGFSRLQATIIESSERTRDQASREISERVSNFLNLAPATVREFQAAVSQGVFNPRDPAALETALFSILVSSPSVSELTLTYGAEAGFDNDGRIILADDGRGQWTVARTPPVTPGGPERLGSRHVRKVGDAFTADVRALGAAV